MITRSDLEVMIDIAQRVAKGEEVSEYDYLCENCEHISVNTRGIILDGRSKTFCCACYNKRVEELDKEFARQLRDKK